MVTKNSLDRIHRELYKRCPEVEMRYYGVATHIISIQNFYLVPLPLYRLLPMLEIPGRRIEVINEDDLVVYYSPILGQYVRGVVHKMHADGSCHMYALDYGKNDMEISRDSIYNHLNSEANIIPGLAQLCKLSMCFPRREGYFPDDANEAFIHLMGQKREKLTITIKEMTSSQFGVLVISSLTNPDDISTVLAYTNHSSFYPAPL